jgi:hypothetical protein
LSNNVYTGAEAEDAEYLARVGFHLKMNAARATKTPVPTRANSSKKPNACRAHRVIDHRGGPILTKGLSNPHAVGT